MVSKSLSCTQEDFNTLSRGSAEKVVAYRSNEFFEQVDKRKQNVDFLKSKNVTLKLCRNYLLDILYELSHIQCRYERLSNFYRCINYTCDKFC